jgi:hypothetical protein
MRVIILTRDKKAIIKKARAKKGFYKWRKQLYVLSSDRVQNFLNRKGKIAGSELIFYENNPNPVTNLKDKNKIDKSKSFLDEIVLINFIEQTTKQIDRDWGFIDSIGDFFSNPARLIIGLMVLIVILTLMRSQWGALLG